VSPVACAKSVPALFAVMLPYRLYTLAPMAEDTP
jgi:hypothetical protein